MSAEIKLLKCINTLLCFVNLSLLVLHGSLLENAGMTRELSKYTLLTDESAIKPLFYALAVVVYVPLCKLVPILCRRSSVREDTSLCNTPIEL